MERWYPFKCIDADADAARESWRNINAIDDVVREIINTDDKVSVAALRNNAGAGGAIMPLACDMVCARGGVVLNPHYLTMGLYGSEYWTYLLPKRVGQAMAHNLIEGCMPLLVSRAREIRMVDKVFVEDWDVYHQSLQSECEAMTKDDIYFPMLEQKREKRATDEASQPLESYRSAELRKMKATFEDANVNIIICVQILLIKSVVVEHQRA